MRREEGNFPEPNLRGEVGDLVGVEAGAKERGMAAPSYKQAAGISVPLTPAVVRGGLGGEAGGSI